MSAMSFGASGTRDALNDLRAAATPGPRTAFVLDLEERLTELMRTSALGDLLPEIELAPPPPRGVEAMRVRVAATVGAAALCAAVLVGAVLAGPAQVPQELRMAAARHGVSLEPDDGAGSADAADASADGPVDDESGSDHARPGSLATTGGAYAVHERARPVESRAATTPATTLDGESPVAPAPVDSSHEGAPRDGSAVVAQREETIGLRVSGTAARVAIDWDRYDGDGFAAYLVLRANDDDVPEYPDESGRTLILLRIENCDALHHEDTPKVGTTPRYRVIAVGKDGRELARSAAETPASPLGASARLGTALGA